MIAPYLAPVPSATDSEPYAHITYEHFGIDPQSFYRKKFSSEFPTFNLFDNPATKFDIEYTRLRFSSSWIKPQSVVLDLGCGSGPLSVSVKQHCRVNELVGIDMDPACIQNARGKYDRTLVFEIAKTLPFPDDYFDVVYSLDFFGHVEFRHKNDLIREIQRVTRPGGLSLHAIESMDFDYDALDPANTEDSGFKYITAEGHVGMESAERLRERWSARFEVLSLENAFIYPFYGLHTYLFDDKFDRDFRDLLATFTSEQRLAAQVCLGYVCDYLKELARKEDPDLLTPVSADDPPSDKANGDIAAKIFQKPCGLVLLAAQKPF